MASNERVVHFLSIAIPDESGATLDDINGASFENVHVYDFDAADPNYLDHKCYLTPEYSGGGLNFRFCWNASSATTGNVVWGIAIRRFPHGGEDIDSSHTYSYQTKTQAVITGASETAAMQYTEITLSDGTQMDNLASGELFILRTKRAADDASDTAAGDVELFCMTAREI